MKFQPVAASATAPAAILLLGGGVSITDTFATTHSLTLGHVALRCSDKSHTVGCCNWTQMRPQSDECSWNRNKKSESRRLRGLDAIIGFLEYWFSRLWDVWNEARLMKQDKRCVYRGGGGGLRACFEQNLMTDEGRDTLEPGSVSQCVWLHLLLNLTPCSPPDLQ